MDLEDRVQAISPDTLDRFAGAVNRFLGWLSRHWAGLLNVLILLYVGVPFLAPVFMRVGATGAGNLIYAIYRPACHQLPERSYFLFGPAHVYDLSQLEAAGVLPGNGIFERRYYVGDAEHGWKVAVCERDVAIYGAMFLLSFFFWLRKKRIPRLPVQGYLVLLIPIAVDGLTQLVGLRTSNWWLRTITGAIFGAATIWLAYPYLAEAMADLRQELQSGDTTPVA